MAKGEKADIKLQETKGTIELRGIIVGKDTPKAGFGLKEGKLDSGKSYKAIKFSVKTSDDNIVPVELFGSEMDNAYLYSKGEKKSVPVEWAKRSKTKIDGYELIEPDFDKVQRIADDFSDGDHVVIIGKIRFGTYSDSDGNVKLQQQYTISQIYKSDKEFDFEAEDFEEKAIFTQQIVVTDIDTTDEKKTGMIYVNAYIINYGEKFVPARFVINSKEYDSLAKGMKGLKFGDQIKLEGVIHYRALSVAVDDGWGKKQKVATTYDKKLEITWADGTNVERKKYTESDFVVTDSAPSTKSNTKIKKKQTEFKSVESDDEGTTDDEEVPFELD